MSSDRNWGQVLLIGAGVVAAGGALWYLYSNQEVASFRAPSYAYCRPESRFTFPCKASSATSSRQEDNQDAKPSGQAESGRKTASGETQPLSSLTHFMHKQPVLGLLILLPTMPGTSWLDLLYIQVQTAVLQHLGKAQPASMKQAQMLGMG